MSIRRRMLILSEHCESKDLSSSLFILSHSLERAPNHLVSFLLLTHSSLKTTRVYPPANSSPLLSIICTHFAQTTQAKTRATLFLSCACAHLPACRRQAKTMGGYDLQFTFLCALQKDLEPIRMPGHRFTAYANNNLHPNPALAATTFARLLSPTCTAINLANTSGAAANALRTLSRNRGRPCKTCSAAAMFPGRRAICLCLLSYSCKSPDTIASTAATACSNPSRNPSPVIASTVPDASPIKITFPRTTRRKRCVPVTPPRSVVEIFSPRSLPASSACSAKSVSIFASASLFRIATQISFPPTGVTYACDRAPQ